MARANGAVKQETLEPIEAAPTEQDLLEWCALREAKVTWFRRRHDPAVRVKVTVGRDIQFEGSTLSEAAELCEARYQRCVSRIGERRTELTTMGLRH